MKLMFSAMPLKCMITHLHKVYIELQRTTPATNSQNCFIKGTVKQNRILSSHYVLNSSNTVTSQKCKQIR